MRNYLLLLVLLVPSYWFCAVEEISCEEAFESLNETTKGYEYFDSNGVRFAWTEHIEWTWGWWMSHDTMCIYKWKIVKPDITIDMSLANNNDLIRILNGQENMFYYKDWSWYDYAHRWYSRALFSEDLLNLKQIESQKKQKELQVEFEVQQAKNSIQNQVLAQSGMKNDDFERAKLDADIAISKLKEKEEKQTNSLNDINKTSKNDNKTISRTVRLKAQVQFDRYKRQYSQLIQSVQKSKYKSLLSTFQKKTKTLKWEKKLVNNLIIELINIEISKL